MSSPTNVHYIVALSLACGACATQACRAKSRTKSCHIGWCLKPHRRFTEGQPNSHVKVYGISRPAHVESIKTAQNVCRSIGTCRFRTKGHSLCAFWAIWDHLRRCAVFISLARYKQVRVCFQPSSVTLLGHCICLRNTKKRIASSSLSETYHFLSLSCTLLALELTLAASFFVMQ